MKRFKFSCYFHCLPNFSNADADYIASQLDQSYSCNCHHKSCSCSIDGVPTVHGIDPYDGGLCCGTEQAKAYSSHQIEVCLFSPLTPQCSTIHDRFVSRWQLAVCHLPSSPPLTQFIVEHRYLHVQASTTSLTAILISIFPITISLPLAALQRCAVWLKHALGMPCFWENKARRTTYMYCGKTATKRSAPY